MGQIAEAMRRREMEEAGKRERAEEKRRELEEARKKQALRDKQREERGLERGSLEWELDECRDSLYLAPGLLDKGSKVPPYKVTKIEEGIYLAELYSLRRAMRAEIELREDGIYEGTCDRVSANHFHINGRKHRLLVDTREAKGVREAFAYLVSQECPLKRVDTDEYMIRSNDFGEDDPYSEQPLWGETCTDREELEKYWAKQADSDIPEEALKEIAKNIGEGYHLWRLEGTFGESAMASDFLNAEIKACATYHNSLLASAERRAKKASKSASLCSKGSKALGTYAGLNSRYSVEDGEALTKDLLIRGKGEGGEIKEPNLSARTTKTLVMLTAEADKLEEAGKYKLDGKSVCRITMSLDEIGELLGLTHPKSVERRMRADFETIGSNSYSFKSGRRWAMIPIVGDVCIIKDGIAEVALAPTYVRLALRGATPTLIPKALFKTDDINHPAAFPLGYYLTTLSTQNAGKGNEYRVRVISIFQTVAELNAKDVDNKDKHTARDRERAIERLEKQLNHLVEKGALKDWDYCHERGEALTDEERDTQEQERQLGKALPWDIAKDCLITWEFTDEYEDERAEPRRSLIESREKRATRAKVIKEAAKKEAKKSKDRQRRARDKRLGELEAEDTHKAKKRKARSKKRATKDKA